MKFYEHFDEVLGKHFKTANEKGRYLVSQGLLQLSGDYSSKRDTTTKSRMTREYAINRFGPRCIPFWDMGKST